MSALDLDQERRHLAQAERHILQAKGFISRQQLIIEELTAKGYPTDETHATLKALQRCLHSFERHHAIILNELRADLPPSVERVAGHLEHG
jgi:hypothetical protein